jgi:hypothetical protein
MHKIARISIGFLVAGSAERGVVILKTDVMYMHRAPLLDSDDTTIDM